MQTAIESDSGMDEQARGIVGVAIEAERQLGLRGEALINFKVPVLENGI